jgi:hypothetical protein
MHSEKVIRAGKKIVKELSLDKSVDTLGRWMAHYIAEMIEDIENGASEAKPKKLSECANAIMELWKHRSENLHGKPPFGAISRTLESLDPNNAGCRYFTFSRSSTRDSEQDKETAKWLDFAELVDRTARILIQACLKNAAQNNLDQAKEYVELAEMLYSEDEKNGIIQLAARFGNDEKTPPDSRDYDESAHIEAETFIKHLDLFVSFANELSSELRKNLEPH